MQELKILYLSYDGMTDPLGQSQVIPYLSGLSQKGYVIHLVSFEKEDKQAYSNEIKHLLNHAGIVWHPLKYHAKPPVISTLFDIWQLFKIVKQLHKTHQFKLVHCRSYITALVGHWLQQKHGVKFLFDMRGFFADERVDGNIWNLKNPIFKSIYQFFKNKEKVFFGEADHTICLTHEGKRIIEQQIMAHSKCCPISVIPCCTDTELFDPKNISESEKTVYRKRLNVNEKQEMIAYLGSIGTWYMLPEMLDFFRMMLIKSPKTILLFITKENPKVILEEARQKGIATSNIRIIKAERQVIPTLLSLAKAGLFFIKPVFSKKASSPTKQGEFMSMGLPVICNSGVGDTDFVIDKYQSGVLVDEFNELAYHQAIHQLNKQAFNSVQEIRKGAIDYFSLEKGIDTYLKVYNSLIGVPTPNKEEKILTN